VRTSIALCLASFTLVTVTAQVPDLRTRAEITDYAETTRYDDVVRLVNGIVASSPLAKSERFGASEEGRALPLLILSEPAVDSPEAARKLNRPVVFVMANIHAGEVEGKEASIMLARRLVSGDLRPLLKQMVVLIAPIYNADGNEKVSVQNRTAQNGPVGGVGTRENTNGLDLNRDYIKLDTAEARALVGLMTRWDPHVSIDLHTTNGSYHGYHLTYSPSLNPNTDVRLLGFARERLLPAVRDAVQKKHGFRTYYYGNFASLSGIARETSRVDPASPGDTIWRTFDHRPRFGNSYVGLRNRIAVLSEAYSYLDFRGRVKVTEAFVEEVLKASAADANRILALTAQVDRETADGYKGELGVDFELAPAAQPVEILVGDVDKKLNPQSGREMLVMTDKAAPVRMPEYGTFRATRSVAMPQGWLLPKPLVDSGRLKPVLDRLQRHGVTVRTLSTPSEIAVERFVIDEVARAERLFQGKYETSIKGRYENAKISVHEGMYFVPAAQPLARLAFYLLEPESDDSLVTWQVLNEGIAKGETYPIYRALTVPK
jgi:hypothetical protein